MEIEKGVHIVKPWLVLPKYFNLA